MTTCKELDRRLEALYPNFKALYNSSGLGFTDFCIAYSNHGLDMFAHDLHQLLLSEGFDSWRGSATGRRSTRIREVGLRMLPSPNGTIRITIRYDGWLHVDCGSGIPLVPTKIRQGAIAITTLIADLHETAQLKLPPCRTCRYSNISQKGALYTPYDIYCGKGLLATVRDVPVGMVSECSGYQAVSLDPLQVRCTNPRPTTLITMNRTLRYTFTSLHEKLTRMPPLAIYDDSVSEIILSLGLLIVSLGIGSGFIFMCMALCTFRTPPLPLTLLEPVFTYLFNVGSTCTILSGVMLAMYIGGYILYLMVLIPLTLITWVYYQAISTK